MTTGKDYPRRELRFFVHKIDAVLRERDQGDRSYKGLLKRVQLNEQQMTQKELICAAAECGSIRVLKWLEKEEVWNPHKDTYALEAADVKGNLVELLKHFQMPLGSYPKVAQGLAFELSALDELQSTSDTSQFRAMEPTPKACLLANLLMVPGEIAENVMERIVERMTVFRRAPGGKQLKPIRSATSFPYALSPISPQRVMVFAPNSGNDNNQVQEHLDRLNTRKLEELKIKAHKLTKAEAVESHQRKWSKINANDEDTRRTSNQSKPKTNPITYKPYKKDDEKGEHRVSLQGSHTKGLRTSKEYPVTFESPAERRRAQIPLSAVHFTYIYGGEDFPTGGFLYLNDKREPVAVNHLDLELNKGYGFAFGPSTVVTEATARACRVTKATAGECRTPESQEVTVPDLQAAAGAIEATLELQEVTVPDLKDAGATHYAWLGPDEKLGPEFHAGPLGGFIYKYKDKDKEQSDDEPMYRFFPLAGSYQLFDRAAMGGELLTCQFLPEDAEGELVQRALDPALNPNMPEATLDNEDEPAFVSSTQGTEAVSIARLTVPHPLHAVVLHALAHTPRSQVLHTWAAKALCQAAFNRILPHLRNEVIARCAELGALLFVTWYVSRGHDGVAERASLVACLAIIALAWLGEVFREVCILSGYAARGLQHYWVMSRTLLWLFFMVRLAFCVLMAHGVVQGYHFKDEARPLLAATACWSWIKLLHSWTCFETFGIGRRILPVLPALADVKDFGIIALIFSLAYLHAMCTLTDRSTSLAHLVFANYRMGFLMDFDVDSDVLFLGSGDSGDHESEQAEPAPWSSYQITCFVMFSFLLGVAMTNIFIGVMGHAFDDQTGRVDERFQRNRAHRALQHALCREGWQRLPDLVRRRCCRCCECRLGRLLVHCFCCCYQRHLWRLAPAEQLLPTRCDTLWFCIPTHRLEAGKADEVKRQEITTATKELRAAREETGHSRQEYQGAGHTERTENRDDDGGKEEERGKALEAEVVHLRQEVEQLKSARAPKVQVAVRVAGADVPVNVS